MSIADPAHGHGPGSTPHGGPGPGFEAGASPYDPAGPPPAVAHFGAGSVLGRGFTIWLQNIVPFTVISLILASPLIVYTAVLWAGDGPSSERAVEVWGLVLRISDFVLDPLAAGAMVYGVLEQLRGRHVGVAACLRVGLSRMLPVLGVGLLVGLITALGLLALIIPGLIFGARYFVAVPVAVVEKPGVWASLKRSAELTLGYKVPIVAVLIVLGGLNLGVTKLAEKIFLADGPNLEDFRVYLVGMLAIVTVFLGWGASAVAVAYHDLRRTRDGVDTADLARVFE